MVISILIFILLTSIGSLYLITVYSHDILNLLQQIETHVKEDRWLEASKNTAKLKKEWAKAQSFFPVFIDHENYHDLGISLTRIEAMVERKKRDDLITEITVAKELIQQIPEQEKLKIKNIF